MKQAAIYISGLLLLTACQHTEKKVTEQNIRKDSINTSTTNVKALNDTVQVVSNELADTAKQIKILNCADYNKGDVDPESAKLKWKGLFKVKDKYYIADTRIKFIREHSEMDEDGQNTGWRLKSNITDNNILLISGASSLFNGPIMPALTSKSLSSIGQTFKFTYYGIDYTLHTTGSKKEGKVYGYKLFLTAKVKGHYFNQLLRSLDTGHSFGSSDDMSEHIEIEFAGDIDGDKIPDFIITGSGYSYGDTYLYLSKPAGNKAILKMVSSFEVTD